MKRKLVQAGGSLAVTLPAEVVQEFGLEKGMTVDVSVHPRTGAVIVRPGVRYFEDGKTTRRFTTAADALLDRRAALYSALAQVTEYLSVAQVLRLHAVQTSRFGGSRRLLDSGALDAAVARPRTTFGGEDLYEDLAAKASALAHSLIQNHPFVDGNKRVGAMAMELFLLANGNELRAVDADLEEVVLAVARGEVAAEALAIWIRQRLRPLVQGP